MAWAAAQHKENVDDSGGSSTTLAATFTNPVSAGSFIAVFCGWGATTGTISASDGTNSATAPSGNTYGYVDQSSGFLYFANHPGGSSVTITVTYSSSVGYRRLSISEWTGIDTSSPIDVNCVWNEVSTGTSTNGAVSSSLTTLTANDLLLAWLQSESNSVIDSITLTAGTGWTAFGNSGEIGRASCRERV